MIERHLPLIATRKATAVRVDAYRAVPLTIQLSIPDDIGSLAGAIILRAEIRASRTDATTTALAGTLIAAPSGQSFDLTFTSAQMNQSLSGEESAEFWLVVYATYPPGVVEGSTELELDVFASIDLVLHEHAASLTAPSPPNAAIALTKTQADLLYMPIGGGGAGTGSVTTVSVVSANGVSGTVANPTSTPAITLALGAITPTSVTATGQVRGGTGVFDTSATITGSANFGNNTVFVYGTNAAANHRSALGLGTAALSAATDFAAATRTVNGQALSSDVTITTISGNAGGFTGSLIGDVTGTQNATAISAATVTGKALTGFVSGFGTITSADSILTAFNKINGNDALKAPLANPTFTGTVSGTFSGSLTGNVTGNVSGTSANFTGLLSGDVTGTQIATAISAATVTGKAITGFVSGSGTVTSSDSIITAINKLNGNTALKADASSLGTLATLSPTGTPSSTTYLRGDNTWATVAAGGFIGTANRIIIGASGTNADSNLETALVIAAPNATDNLTRLSAVGTATNIHLGLMPKGTGAIVRTIPDNLAAGGNARGQYATDFQTVRNAATQVASNNNSFIAGGTNNTASGQQSFAAGTSNIASNTNSFVAGGTINTASGIHSFVAGLNNTAVGSYSAAFGSYSGTGSTGASAFAAGQGASASGDASFAVNNGTSATNYCSSAFGTNSQSYRLASMALAGGKFTAVGDGQMFQSVLGQQTTDGTTQVILRMTGNASTVGDNVYTNATAGYFAIAAGKLISGIVHVHGVNTTGTPGAYTAHFLYRFSIKRQIATTAFNYTPVAIVPDWTSSTMALSLVANDTDDRFDIKVTGVAGETIRWNAYIEALETTFA